MWKALASSRKNRSFTSFRIGKYAVAGKRFEAVNPAVA
jgi:hypothetical protein